MKAVGCMSDEWTQEEAQKMLDDYYEDITGTPEADKFNFGIT